MNQHIIFMQQAISLAKQNIQQGGGPFGAVIVKNNQVISTGANCVTTSNDPTAHAEITAIREACTKLNSFSLEDCTLYSSCEPCPMCLSAIYWAKIKTLYFGATHEDADKAGFRDNFLYKELSLPIHKRSLETHQIQHSEALAPFKEWQKTTIKTLY
jgi:tRNA(Arg) A34 adenosine deaminase TadA